MAASLDPVQAGFVRSLARPGGNITGLTWSVGPEIEAKRLQLLHEAVPGVTRVAYLRGDTEGDTPWVRGVRAAAQALGITLVEVEHAGDDFARAFTAIGGARVAALFVSVNPAAFARRGLIVDFARRHRLPSAHAFRESVEAGGLMSYGVDASDLFRRAAGYVDRILTGAAPGDLPIEQPTRFELVVNLKTARTLGLTIPQAVLVRADEVIE
jgi:putative ABC transport system substrate-binding protein